MHLGLWARHRFIVAALLSFAVFLAFVPRLQKRPRLAASTEMQVAIPRSVQVAMALGDRYLAANLAGFRVLTASTESMTPDGFRIMGIVQSDIAWLNPAHEDNYYLAAAILPWNGEVDAAQVVLRRASDARPFDWQPAFYYGFNEMHFRHDFVEGAKWLDVAAKHTNDDAEQIQLQQLAARWVSKGENLSFAVALHRNMAKSTHNRAFALFLEKRAVRLENLIALDNAVALCHSKYGVLATTIQALVDSGCITEMPVDPFGVEYGIDSVGNPVLAK